MNAETVNHARWLPGQRGGHYESFFQRGNHPTRPLAFWIRYTLFSPEGAPDRGVGELWAIFFDGETGQHVAVKREVPLHDRAASGPKPRAPAEPIARASFDRGAFAVRVDDAVYGPSSLRGAVEQAPHRVAWDVRYHGGERPLLLFPAALYEARLPRAKSLVGAPLCVHEGEIDVDGRVVDVGGWVGSQNHNWGSRHTDHYAWGQVAGFDTHPESFLEVATARLKLGPVWTPFMTPAVLRHRGREHAANGPVALARARGSFGYFTWRLAFETDEVRVAGTITADRGDFVGLAYANPPGGIKHCLNTKIASAALTVTHRASGEVETLATERRAAFEILTDDRSHGVIIRT